MLKQETSKNQNMFFMAVATGTINRTLSVHIVLVLEILTRSH